MKTIFSVLLLGYLTSIAQAQAQAPAVGEGPSGFKKFDANRDGSLSPDKLPLNMRQNYVRVNTNKDGRISKEEHLALVNRNQRQDNSVKRSFPLAEKIETIPNQPYAEIDNPRQQLDLFLPKNRSSKKPLPVVVFIHGGGWQGGDKNGGLAWVGPYVASGDYVGASIEYR